MNSPWGSIGSVCSHYHWTFEYVIWGVAWVNLQMIMADELRYDYEKPEDETKKGNALEDPEAIKNYMMNLSNNIK